MPVEIEERMKLALKIKKMLEILKKRQKKVKQNIVFFPTKWKKHLKKCAIAAVG